MRIIVIGGGPAGMISAYISATQNNQVTLIEKNEKLGKKLYITGKGRCNLTNDCDVEEFFTNVVTNKKFLMSALYGFTPNDTKELFTKFGLKLKTERGNRVFPESDKSSDVIKCMAKMLASVGVNVILNQNVTSLIVENNECLGVTTQNGDIFADKIIVATGGISYSSTGSTGDGYEFAKSVGHTVVQPVAGLSAMLTKPKYPNLAGLSLKNVTLKVYYEDKFLRGEFGEMLFTHEGISGPIVLTLSSYINRLDLSKVKLYIDFKPALDEQTLDNRILRDFEKVNTKQLKNAFDALLPQRIIDVFLDSLEINKEKKVCELSKQDRKKIVNIMKNFPLGKIRLSPIEEAIITSGGISTKEINPKTMQSKLVKNLYFAGEVIDVDALTGGFNIQIALATGVQAGKE